MKKRFVCGSAALLLTGLSAAMFSLAVSRSHEQARSAIDTTSLQTIETVVVERGRYLAGGEPALSWVLPGQSATTPFEKSPG